MTEVAHMLLGGVLVAAGIVVTAVADRIRGVRSGCAGRRMRASEHSDHEVAFAPARQPRRSSLPTEKPEKPEAPLPAGQARNAAADDVIAALVAAGYRKSIAREATWTCAVSERASVEDWTLAALRRAGMS
jgi:hypothetical protein